MPIAHNLGFPPLGPNRELKRATEGYWSGKVPRADLLRTGATLRAAHWRLQRDAGLDLIPSNDFSYYDRVLDTCAMVGAVPARYGFSGGPVDRTPQERAAYGRAYRFLAERAPQLKLLVATYFAGLDDSLPTPLELPVAGLHVDLVRAPRQLDQLLKAWPKGRVLSLGVIDGRNVWRADLAAALGLLERARERIGPDELWVAPSCSLLHVPVDLDLERRLDPDLKGWLAFAKQKLAEVATLTRAVRDGREAVAGELEANARAIVSRRSSRRIHDPAVTQRPGPVGERRSPTAAAS